MIKALRSLLLAVVASAWSLSALAGDRAEAHDWLERMATAMNHMSYQGTFVYVRGDQVETMRITHVVDEHGLRERLYSVTGPDREIIRDSEGVRCVLSDDQSIMEDAVVNGTFFPDFPVDDLTGSDQVYRLETGGVARIAGQIGRRVTIVPGDEFRYGYDLWLESRTGLLLKWVLFDARKQALAKLVFTDLRFGNEVDESELESDTPPDAFTRLQSGMPAHQVTAGADPEWQPERLPPGFRLATHRHQADEEGLFEHLVYSDGLASVSVYIESGEDTGLAPGLSRLGTANAFTRRVGGRHVTVIGEVPAATVQAIGAAIKGPPGAR